MSPPADAPTAAIYGLSGPELTAEERDFFAAAQPLGFILFARNCREPAQIKALTAALRETVGRPQAPVLIDQEGGRVQRLRPPQWRATPPAQRFGDLARRDFERGLRAAWLNGRLLAAELAPLGIDVDCVPCLDVRGDETHAVIGDRAFDTEAERVAALGRAVAEGLRAGGVLPVAKHMPGHGRAGGDSHHELPVVAAPLADLRARDFAPFRALADLPLGMTAHVVYSAIDPRRPATLSEKVVNETIRGEIGFDGLLMTDDLGMRALSGGFAQRAEQALQAGCDIVLHCSGAMEEMQAVAGAVPVMDEARRRRWAAALAWRRPPAPCDQAADLAALDALLGAA